MPTHNRARYLGRALESLVKQTMETDRLEIIVIDDGSDDETQKLVGEMMGKHPTIKLVSSERNLGSSGARNLGLAQATGQDILFTDDDCIPQNYWAEAMSAALDDEPVVAGCIEVSNSKYVKLCHNISHFHPFIPRRRSGPVDFMAGANMGLRRNVMDELGGFDDKMILAGDMQLCLRARSRGYQPYLTAEAVVVHDPCDISLAGAVKSSFVHAASTIFLRNQYRSLLRTPFLLKYPWLIRLASPLISLKVTTGIYLKNPRLLLSFWTMPLVFLLKLIWCFGAASGLQKSKSDQGKS
jgi:glycosyltransferase involved in cell wall biosynthesis